MRRRSAPLGIEHLESKRALTVTGADGIAVGGRAIVLPTSASIRDAAGNAATGRLPSANLSRILVDGVGPPIPFQIGGSITDSLGNALASLPLP